MKLTDRVVRSLRPKAGQRVVRLYDTATPGLMVQATNSGARTYYFVYRNEKFSGRYFRIASVDDLDLADARDEVRKLRAARVPRLDPATGRTSNGIDPAKERARTQGSGVSAHVYGLRASVCDVDPHPSEGSEKELGQ